MSERTRADDTAGVIAERYSLGTGPWTMRLTCLRNAPDLAAVSLLVAALDI
ncbi:hypothetical protein [Streptomyces tibetensis]|uniref:hypothetical protein n=1 Tax=Streptomyces tibetensis TaxID=2382123 RepID=UPI0033F0860D